MKIGEIIRKIADITDIAGGNEVEVQPEVEIEPKSVTPELDAVEVDNVDHTDDGVMVPPLQQKHELLKKATGVDNDTEQFADDDEDELDQLKKMAGLDNSAAILQIASDNIHDVD